MCAMNEWMDGMRFNGVKHDFNSASTHIFGHKNKTRWKVYKCMERVGFALGVRTTGEMA